MGQGTLEAIWVKTAKRGPMKAVSTASMVAGKGIVGNADFGGARQVTIIEKEVFELLQSQVSEDVAPSDRRANLMVSGVDLRDSASKVLCIGDIRIRLQGETRPCGRMEQAASGLQDKMALMWRGGAWGDVLDEGEIQLGDTVAWES